jgi:hypothetical protein
MLPLMSLSAVPISNHDALSRNSSVQGPFRRRVVPTRIRGHLLAVKRPLAAVALVVLTWSNATALQCAGLAVAPRTDPTAPAQDHGSHAHAPASPDSGEAASHTHGGPAQQVGHDGSHGGDHDGDHRGRTDCGVLMACGAALGARMGSDEARPEALQKIEAAPVSTPSTADLSRDPPPPRRIA